MANISKIIIVIASLSLFLTGCQLGQKKTENEQNKIPVTTEEARKQELRNRIDVKYSDAEAHYEMGKFYQEDGLWERAEMEFTTATGFDPAHWRAEAAKVKVLTQTKDNSKAAFTAEHAMNRARVSAESSLLLGKAFQKEQLDDYAVSCYHQALALAPNSAALHKQIGYYYLSKNQRERAEGYLRRSFQLDPYQSGEVAGELGRLGVPIQMPRNIQNDTKKLDKILNSKDGELKK